MGRITEREGLGGRASTPDWSSEGTPAQTPKSPSSNSILSPAPDALHGQPGPRGEEGEPYPT